jgi:hypothetical protein
LLSLKFARAAFPSSLHDYTYALHPGPSLSPCSSRPASRATSLCGGAGGSSGYESSITRCHLGPHYSDHNMPRAHSPEPKYNSLKPRRRKQQQHHHHHQQQQQQAGQFYSLRLCRKHRQRQRKSCTDDESRTARSYQLYAIPIYRTCPHKSASNSTIATSLRSAESTPLSTLSRDSDKGRKDATGDGRKRLPEAEEAEGRPPPVPAPRATRKTDPSEHTYQNVPPPVFPQNLPADSKLKVCPLVDPYNRSCRATSVSTLQMLLRLCECCLRNNWIHYSSFRHAIKVSWIYRREDTRHTANGKRFKLFNTYKYDISVPRST